jgi:Fe-S cluster assembly protein SufD
MGTAAWADAARAEAEKNLTTLPDLTGREEEWRFTPPVDLGLSGPMAAPADVTVTAIELTMEGAGPRAARQGFVDGQVAGPVTVTSDLPEGVVVVDLGDALSLHEELLKERLYSLVGFDDRPGALNAAHWESGTLVYVPRGVKVTLPIEAVHAVTGAHGRVFGRTLLVAEEGSEVTVVERFVGGPPPGEGSVQVSSMVEIFAGPNSKVDHYGLVTWDPGVRHHLTVTATTDRDARFRSMVVTLGGDVVRVEPTVVLAGAGASAEALGLYFATGNQHFEHRVVSRHEAPNSYSNLLYKGAIQDTAHTVFYGNLIVRPGAGGTDAYQTNRNLVLNEGARADTIPFLEIETAEVKCSHAGAVGRVDDEHLFYLESRGVPREMAKKLIVLGFIQEVLGMFDLPDLHDELEAAVEEKIR